MKAQLTDETMVRLINEIVRLFLSRMKDQQEDVRSMKRQYLTRCFVFSEQIIY